MTYGVKNPRSIFSKCVRKIDLLRNFPKQAIFSDVLASILGVLKGYLTGNQRIHYGNANMFQSNVLKYHKNLIYF